MQARFNKSIIDQAQFLSLTFQLKSKRSFVFAAGWSLKKGEWWYEGDPSNVKFFDIGKTVYDSGLEQYGIYIGRLALVFMKEENGNKVTDEEESYGF